MNYVLALLLYASSPQLDCFPTKEIVKPLIEREYKPVELGTIKQIPFIIVENPHGKELMILFPNGGGMACPMGAYKA